MLLVLPIGGADMPVVISLLNSYAGLASAATGFAIGNNVLIIAGALDGASGFILSILMSQGHEPLVRQRALRRLRHAGGDERRATSEGLTVRAVTVEDAAVQLAYARSVIVVPGYGMAVAQAQHEVRELADLIEKRGGEVKLRHPPGGRPHAGPHERAAGRGQRALRQAATRWTRSTASSRAPTWPW